MASRTELDGNAIAGLLVDVFGNEMTGATGTCAACGAQAYLAELRVFMHAMGPVGRCRACGSVEVVFVTIRGTTCVDLRGLAALDAPFQPASPR